VKIDNTKEEITQDKENVRKKNETEIKKTKWKAISAE
jgi:hypothetical protein